MENKLFDYAVTVDEKEVAEKIADVVVTVDAVEVSMDDYFESVNGEVMRDYE